MTREDILQRIADVVEDVLDIAADEVTEELSQETCEDWDSLVQITLLVSVESEFGLKFDAKQMAGLKSVRAIIDAVEANGGVR